MRSFLTLLSGNAVSTGISLVTAIVLARTLAPSGFVLANLLLTLMVVVALGGGGVDSAAVRLIARGSNDVAVVRIAVVPRVLCFLLVLVVSPLLVVPANATPTPDWLAVLSFLALGAGITVLFLSLIEPIAKGRSGAFARRQVFFYLALGLGSLLGLRGELEPVLVAFTAVGGATLAVGLFWWLKHRRAHSLSGEPRSEFRRLVPMLVLSTLGFAVFERVDVMLVSIAAESQSAAEFAVAVRFAGGLALVTGAFAAFATPRVARASDDIAHQVVVRELRGPFSMVLVATALAIPLSLIALPVLFGSQYSGNAAVAAAVLALQFPLAAFQVPYAVAFPHIGRSSWLIELVVLLIVVKLAIILLVPDSSIGYAPAAPAAQACGCLYVVWRGRQFRRSDHLSSPVVSQE